MAKFNVENEHVEVEIEKLYKFSPELVYEAWTKKRFVETMVYDISQNE